MYSKLVNKMIHDLHHHSEVSLLTLGPLTYIRSIKSTFGLVLGIFPFWSSWVSSLTHPTYILCGLWFNHYESGSMSIQPTS